MFELEKEDLINVKLKKSFTVILKRNIFHVEASNTANRKLILLRTSVIYRAHCGDWSTTQEPDAMMRLSSLGDVLLGTTVLPDPTYVIV